MHNIIFDYDGTIHKTSYIYYQAFLKAYDFLVENGYAEAKSFKLEEVTKWLGYNKYEMWASFAPDLDEKIRDKASDIIGSQMLELIANHKAKLYDGITDVLSNLKNENRQLFILSNCKNSYMQAHRKEFGLDEYFADYFCAEAYDFIAKEEIFKDIAKKYPGPFIMVGDRFHDIKAAKENQLISIGAAYGYGEEKELQDATYLAKEPKEIYTIIKKIEK